MSNVDVSINPSAVRELFRSEEMSDALFKVGVDIADKCDARIRSHLRSPMRMELVDVRTKKTPGCYICIVQARSFKKGAKGNRVGPAVVAEKYNCITQ